MMEQHDCKIITTIIIIIEKSTEIFVHKLATINTGTSN